MKKSLPMLRSLSFWHYQIAGWILFWLADFVLMSLKDMKAIDFFVESLEVPLAFGLSLLLREIYKRVNYKRLSIPVLFVYVMIWSLIFTIVWYAGIVALWYVAVDPSYALPLMNFRVALRWINYFIPIWLGWSSLYFGIKYWRDWEDERLRARDATLLAQRAQLQMLRYQLNPHFLFNALNSLRALVSEDRRNAKLMVTELSEFLRYSLVHRDLAVVPLREELEAVRHYLSIEKRRFEDKLQVKFDIQPEVEEDPILGFLLHPLVENAIKYGMKSSSLPLTVHIAALRKNGGTQVSVTNSGSWYVHGEDEELQSGTGTGLTNVRMRLENAYPGQHAIEVSTDEGEVRVSIEIHKTSGEMKS